MWAARRADGQKRSGPYELGAGRIIHMDITRIDLMSRMENFQASRATSRRWSGGAHASASSRPVERWRRALAHTASFCAVANGGEQHVERVFIQLLPGWPRPPPHSASIFQQLQQKNSRDRLRRIASLTGRYYAMDRGQSLGARRARYRARRSRRFSCEARPILSKPSAAATNGSH